MEQPEANAPAPEVMRAELINIMVAKCGGKITRTKAEQVVDAILEKQMRYYAEMADSEVDTSSLDAAMVAAELPGRAQAVIEQGARFVQFMSTEQKTAWQGAAERLRDSCRKLVDLIQ